jgi:hypothetical protein
MRPPIIRTHRAATCATALTAYGATCVTAKQLRLAPMQQTNKMLVLKASALRSQRLSAASLLHKIGRTLVRHAWQ